MIDMLHHVPNIQVFALIIGTLVIGVLAAPRLARLLGMKHTPARSEGALEVYKVIVGSTAFVLALSLSQVQSNLRSTEEGVSREVSAVIAVDRILTRYGDPATTALRAVLRDYATLIIEDEWPLLNDGGRSTKTELAYNMLSKAARSIEPDSPRRTQLLSELYRQLDDVADTREARLGATLLSLQGLFWWVVAALMVMLVVLSAFITPTTERSMQVSGMICALGLLLALVIIIDGPFSGDTSIEPDLMRKALVRMAARV